MCEYGLGLGDWLKRGVVVPLGGCTHVRVRSVPHRPSFPSELFASDGNGMKQRKAHCRHPVYNHPKPQPKRMFMRSSTS